MCWLKYIFIHRLRFKCETLNNINNYKVELPFSYKSFKNFTAVMGATLCSTGKDGSFVYDIVLLVCCIGFMFEIWYIIFNLDFKFNIISIDLF